mgnify:CR=1 FL=1
MAGKVIKKRKVRKWRKKILTLEHDSCIIVVQHTNMIIILWSNPIKWSAKALEEHLRMLYC